MQRTHAADLGPSASRLLQNWASPRHQGILMRKILVMGLPGAGKTTFAGTLAPLLNAVVFNADAVRTNISRDLGFSHEDRVEHARRMVGCVIGSLKLGTEIADF